MEIYHKTHPAKILQVLQEKNKQIIQYGSLCSLRNHLLLIVPYQPQLIVL